MPSPPRKSFSESLPDKFEPNVTLPETGGSFKYAIPKLDGGPWTTCLEPLFKEGTIQVNAWQDEVQNLLIFAGLFSAVVTAFIVESYKLLSLDPDDRVISLLTDIASQLANNSTTPPLSLQSRTSFSPDPSSIRINIFWFISLILSLTTVLVGIVSLQWLREYQHYPSHLTPAQAFAMRNMPFEGFKKWYIPQIFSGLPLLQCALILVFIGIAEFLLALDITVAVPVIAIAAIPITFLVITTISPALQRSPDWTKINWDQKPSVSAQCPYKSPQSWAFYRITPYWIKSLVDSISKISAVILGAIPTAASQVRRSFDSASITRLSRRIIRRSRTFQKITRFFPQVREKYLPWALEEEYLLPGWTAFSCIWLHSRNTTITGTWHAYGLTNPESVYDAFEGIKHLVALNYSPHASSTSAVYYCFQEILEKRSERLRGLMREHLLTLRNHDEDHVAVPIQPVVYSKLDTHAREEVDTLQLLICSSWLLREDRDVVNRHAMELIIRIYRKFLTKGWLTFDLQQLVYNWKPFEFYDRDEVGLLYGLDYAEIMQELWTDDRIDS